MSYTLRSKNSDGTINGTAVTAEQAATLAAGRASAYSPRDERLLVDDDGQIIHRESAIPQQLDEAA
ncbi:MAG TPA: hypothetical protein VGR11_13080 [Solirubrobacteraceae bacterium]|nr:hypothetical protein [Solirubrobacteraceae bacterium]